MNFIYTSLPGQKNKHLVGSKAVHIATHDVYCILREENDKRWIEWVYNDKKAGYSVAHVNMLPPNHAQIKRTLELHFQIVTAN